MRPIQTRVPLLVVDDGVDAFALAAQIAALREEWTSQGLTDIRFEIEPAPDTNTDGDDSVTCVIVGYRPETDDERRVRVDAYRRAKEVREQRKRQRYY